MSGIDKLLAKSLSAALKAKIAQKTLLELEIRLFEKHGISIKQSIEEFQKLDSTLSEFLGSENRKLEKECFENICSIKNLDKDYQIVLKDKPLNKIVFDCWGDIENQKILNVILNESFTAPELVTKSEISKTSGYRNINSLIKVGLIVNDGTSRTDDGKIIPKHKSVFDQVTITISTDKISISGLVRKKFINESSVCQLVL